MCSLNFLFHFSNACAFLPLFPVIQSALIPHAAGVPWSLFWVIALLPSHLSSSEWLLSGFFFFLIPSKCSVTAFNCYLAKFFLVSTVHVFVNFTPISHILLPLVYLLDAVLVIFLDSSLNELGFPRLIFAVSCPASQPKASLSRTASSKHDFTVGVYVEPQLLCFTEQTVNRITAPASLPLVSASCSTTRIH